MKRLSLFILPLFFFSCHTSNAPVAVSSFQTDHIISDSSTTILRTDSVKRFPKVKDLLPEGFAADTISSTDTITNFVSDVVYLYLRDSSQLPFKKLVYKMINTGLNEFKESLPAANESDPSYPLPSYFDAFYDSCYMDKNIVSLRYVVSIYSSGAAHQYTHYVSINYDKRTKKIITAKDYFGVKTKKDSLAILTPLEKQFGLFSENLANGNLWKFYGLSDAAFTITKDSISFNFSDYALGQGPSLLDCKISREELKNAINPRYR